MIPLLIMNSRITEIDGTTVQIIRACESAGLTTDNNLAKIMNPLKDLSASFSVVIKQLKEKSQQRSNDELRDEKVTALYYLLKGAEHHPNEEISNAAALLLEIFEQYGLELKEESYTRESSLINSLLNDYMAEKAQAAIARVPEFSGYFTALQEAQSNFESGRLIFEEARATEGTIENASVMKKDVLELINKQLVPYLNVMVQLDDATYGTLAGTIAEIISGNNEVVKKRHKKKDTPE